MIDMWSPAVVGLVDAAFADGHLLVHSGVSAGSRMSVRLLLMVH